MTFDAVEYFRGIQESLKLLKGSNRFYRVTSIGHLEELMNNLRNVNYPCLCIDDSQDGYLNGDTGGYNDSRYYSVFILAKVRANDSDDRNAKMAECREIFRKILSKMIIDAEEFRNEMVWMHPNRIKYDEVGYLADDLFGIHFGFTVEQPEDLIYDAADWDS